MHIAVEYWDRGPAGPRVRTALISDVRPYGSPAAPRAVIGFKIFSPEQLDGSFVIRARDVRAIERLRRHGFRVIGPEFLSRTPHPGAAEKDPDGTGSPWW